MKKKLSIVLAVAMICLSLLGMLAACNSPEKEALTNYIFESEGKPVEGELILPKTIGQFAATWTSSSNLITIEEREEDFLAKITRPETEVEEVKLTVTVGKEHKDFTVRVLGISVYDIADNYYFPYASRTLVPGTYDLESKTTYNEKEATITWSVDDAYKSYLKVENGKLVVTVKGDAIEVKLTGTFSYNNETAPIRFKFKVSETAPLVDLFKQEIISNPKVNTPYKLGLYQGQLGKVLYALDTLQAEDKAYINMTEDVTKAADAVLETAEGGYYLKLGAKYVTLTGRLDGDKVKSTISLTDTASTVFKIDKDNYYFYSKHTVTGEDGKTYEGETYLGTYSSYNTISTSMISYITGDSGVKTIDVSQFPARLVTDKKIEGGTTPAEPAPTEVTIAKALEICEKLGATGGETTEKYKITGKIGEITNTQYGNGKLVDATDASVSIEIYGMYDKTGATRYDNLSVKPVAGETVTLVGTLSKYVGKDGTAKLQIKNARVQDDKYNVVLPTEVTIAKALEIGATLTEDTTVEYKLTGKLGKITSTTYGNSTLIDLNDPTVSITVYGMYDKTGKTRYDAMSVKPAEGETVTLVGVLTKFKDTIEIKNARVQDDKYNEATIPAVSKLPEGAAATVDFSKDTGIAVTKEGTFKDYQGNDKTGGIQKKVTVDGVAITNDIATSTNAVTVQYDTTENGSARFYAKSTLTIEYTGMKKIVFVTDSKNFTDKETISVEGATWTVEGEIATLTFTAPVNSVIITLDAQVRIAAIGVYTK